MNQSLTLTYVAETIPEDSYWLTIQNLQEGDKATLADVAATVDNLFKIDPCIKKAEAPKPPTQAEKTKQDLLDAARASFKIEQCKVDKVTGDYDADLQIIRSHPELPYKLVLSVGTIKRTVIKSETVSVSLDVKDATSIVLPRVRGLHGIELKGPGSN